MVVRPWRTPVSTTAGPWRVPGTRAATEEARAPTPDRGALQWDEVTPAVATVVVGGLPVLVP